MHSTRHRLVFALAAAACLAVAAVATEVAATCRRAGAAVAACLVGGLKLFTAPKLELQKVPHARQGLTARERHDLADGPTMRPTVNPRWRMCPST
jgi:hypothetical protein